MAGCDIAMVTAIVPHIYQEFAWPGKFLEKEDEPGRGLYCIERGFLQATEHGKLTNLLTRGDFFGETSLLNDEPSVNPSLALALAPDLAVSANLHQSPQLSPN